MRKRYPFRTRICQACGWSIYLDHPGTHNCLENPFYAAKQVVKSMTQERRNEILTLFKSGLTIGETAKQAKVSTYQVSEIILLNIESAEYLRSESL